MRLTGPKTAVESLDTTAKATRLMTPRGYSQPVFFGLDICKDLQASLIEINPEEPDLVDMREATKNPKRSKISTSSTRKTEMAVVNTSDFAVFSTANKPVGEA